MDDKTVTFPGSAANSPSNPEDLQKLMVGYQRADAEATTRLVDVLSPRLFRFFLGDVRDRFRAEDLLQDFWLRIHSARHTYRATEPVLPWIYAIARRVRVDHYRRTSRVIRHELQVETLPEAAAPRRDTAGEADLDAMLAELPASQREVVLMLKVAGLTLEEVARATQSSVGSVKQKAHRAYEKLRKGVSHAG